MKFIVCTNYETIALRLDLDAENDSEEIDRILARVDDKLRDLLGFEWYTVVEYSSNFRHWNGGKYDQIISSKVSVGYTNCGVIAVDTDSPSAIELANEINSAFYDHQIS